MGRGRLLGVLLALAGSNSDYQIRKRERQKAEGRKPHFKYQQLFWKDHLDGFGKEEGKVLGKVNCGVGEDSWESLGLQGGPTSPS